MRHLHAQVDDDGARAGVQLARRPARVGPRDDGGFTGASIDRPALTRLLADVEAGKIDVIVVYKVDRLSRSLLDFAKMMERFTAADVSFVSVTQNFSTATRWGGSRSTH